MIVSSGMSNRRATRTWTWQWPELSHGEVARAC